MKNRYSRRTLSKMINLKKIAVLRFKHSIYLNLPVYILINNSGAGYTAGNSFHRQ